MTKDDLKQSILKHALSGKLTEEFHPKGETQYIEELDLEIPISWEWKKLGEVCEIINGFTPLKSNKEFWNKDEIPWFTVEDIHLQGRTINKTNKFITKKALGNSTKRLLPKNTVLICCTSSTIGEYAITNIELTTNQQFNGLVIKDKKVIYNLYLMHYISTLKDNLKNKSNSTTFSFLSVKKLGEFQIPLPPLDEQEAIVKKVESLYEKVDKLENLEEDLDQLREDLKESIIQYGISGQLTENFRISKGEKIEYTEDADKPFPIPTNWEWKKLEDVANNSGGFAFKSNEIKEKGIRIIRISDFDNNGINDNDKKYYDYSERLDQFKIKANDILMCMTGGTVGKACYIEIISEDMYINQRVALIRNKENITSKYLYYIIKSNMIKKIINDCKTSTNDNISKSQIDNFPIPFPPLDEQEEIVKKIENIFSIIDKL